MKTFWHLVKRFLGSIQQKSISKQDLLWVEEILSQSEMALWKSMPENDQYHSIEVARRVDESLEESEQTTFNPESYYFPDTNTASLEGKAAAYLRGKGIITGYPDGELREPKSYSIFSR